MPGIAETNRRRGKVTRLLCAFQSAKGTVAGDFTASGTSAVLWPTDWKFPAARRKSTPGPWMTEAKGEATASRHSLPENPGGIFRLNCTPEALRFLLRSNFGPFAAGSFTLRTQIADTEFLTLAWVEEDRVGAVQRLVRIPDVFIHIVRVFFDHTRVDGIAILEAEWQGRAPLAINDLDALPGGVVLPTTPIKPPKNKFRGQRATLIRDPTGLNVSLRYKRLELELGQGLISKWTMTDGWDVAKRGKTKARLRHFGNWSDETWDTVDDNRADIRRDYRLSATSDGPSPETLTVDFREMDFEVEPAGRTGLRHDEYEAQGQAHVGASGLVAVALS